MAYIAKHRKSAPRTSDLGIGGPGKGSRPRNCFSPEFRSNYDRIFRKKTRVIEKTPSRLVKNVVDAVIASQQIPT